VTDRSTVRDLIWAYERGIYEARAKGTLQPYTAALAPGFMAWPPSQDRPIGPATLHQHSDELQPFERLELRFVDFTLNGPTAIIYYETHRTVRPDGSPVDERFMIIHVWVETQDGWRILGGMGRQSAAVPGDNAG
jgi:hypothetical protein